MQDLVSGGVVKAKINGSRPYAFLKRGAIMMVFTICEPKNHKMQTHCLPTRYLDWNRCLGPDFVFAIYKYENICKGYFCCVEVLAYRVCKESIWQVINEVINLKQSVILMKYLLIWAKTAEYMGCVSFSLNENQYFVFCL